MVKKEIRDFMAFTRSLQLKWTVDRNENTRFPLLGALSRRRLCIQGAAVPSERLFKKARDTCTKKRASMSLLRLSKRLHLRLNKFVRPHLRLSKPVRPHLRLSTPVRPHLRLSKSLRPHLRHHAAME